MVNIQDGSLVPASALLDGEGEDPDSEGGKLRFEEVKGATFPTYRAKAKMNDNSGRTRTYTFSLEDTNVIVHVAQTTEEKEEEKGEDKEKETAAAPAKTEKVVHETKIAESNTNAKKNSSSRNTSNTPTDYRVGNKK